MDKITPHLVEKPWAGGFIRDHFLKTESVYQMTCIFAPEHAVPHSVNQENLSATERVATAMAPLRRHAPANIGEAWLISTLRDGESHVGEKNFPM